MKEIKFRAWHKKYKRFAPDNASIQIGGEEPHVTFDGFDGNFYTGVWYLSDCVLVQYTGIKDKNGIEIYEGDVVKFRSQKHKKYITGVVAYICAEFRISHDYGNPLISGDVYDECVIGNVYENPELLK